MGEGCSILKRAVTLYSLSIAEETPVNVFSALMLDTYHCLTTEYMLKVNNKCQLT